MKIFIAADHAGFALKAILLEHVRTLKHDVEDLGADGYDPDDDYPDLIAPCAKKVAAIEGSFGIVIGGSGQGEAIAANRIPGVRAAVYYGPAEAASATDVTEAAPEDEYDIVRLGRRHNDANVLSLGARFLSEAQAKNAVRIFLETPFSGDERHVRRIGKI